MADDLDEFLKNLPRPPQTTTPITPPAQNVPQEANELDGFLSQFKPAPRTPEATSPAPEGVEQDLDKLLEPYAYQPLRTTRGYGQAFIDAVERGGRQVQATVPQLGAVTAEIGGNRELAAQRMQQAKEIEALAMPAESDSFIEAMAGLQNRDFERLSYWAVEKVGEQLPVLGTAAVSGGLGALAGRMVGRGLLSSASPAAVRAATVGGGVAGGYAATTAMETADTAGELYDATGSTHPGVSIGAGAVKGALEFITPWALTRRFISPVRERSYARAVGSAVGLEASTEATQELVSATARAYADPNYDFFSTETVRRVTEAAAAGGLVGGVFGLGGEAIARRTTGERPGQQRVLDEDELHTRFGASPVNYLNDFAEGKQPTEGDVSASKSMKVLVDNDAFDLQRVLPKDLMELKDLNHTLSELQEDLIDRYAVQLPNGKYLQKLFTPTEWELYRGITQPTGEQGYKFIKVRPDSLIPANITADIRDLPEPFSSRVFVLPGTSPQVEMQLREQYAQLYNEAKIVKEAFFADGQVDTEISETYGKLLNEGLRIAPSRGSSFFYVGQFDGEEVAEPMHTYRSVEIALRSRNDDYVILPSKTDLSTDYFTVANQQLRSLKGLREAGFDYVSVDFGKLQEGDWSFTPVYSTIEDILKFGKFDPQLSAAERENLAQTYMNLAATNLTADDTPNTQLSNRIKRLLQKGLYFPRRSGTPGEGLLFLTSNYKHALTVGIDRATEVGDFTAKTVRANQAASTFETISLVDRNRIPQGVLRDTEEIVAKFKETIAKYEKVKKIPPVKIIVSDRTTPGNAAEYFSKEQVININTKELLIGHGGTDYRAVLAYVLAHEYGHHITMHTWQKVSPETRAKVWAEYSRQLLAIRTRNKAFDPGTISSIGVTNNNRDVVQTSLRDNVHYWFSFAEYLAEQFFRWSMSPNVKPFTAGERFASTVVKELHEYANIVERLLEDTDKSFVKQYRSEATSGFAQLMAEVLNVAHSAEKPYLRIGAVEGLDVNDVTLGKLQKAIALTVEELSPLFPGDGRVDVTAEGRAGSYLTQADIIKLSIYALDAPGGVRAVLAHEALHRLKALNLFTEPEWNALLVAARREAKLSATEVNRYRQYYLREGKKLGLTDVELREFVDTALDEERVAFLVQERAAGRAFEDSVASLLDRVLEFFRQLAVKLRELLGYVTGEDVLRQLFTGQLSTRMERELKVRAAREQQRNRMDNYFYLEKAVLPGFFSPTLKLIKDFPQETATIKQWQALLSKAPQEEVNWSGIRLWLMERLEEGGTGEETIKVTKRELEQYLREELVDIITVKVYKFEYTQHRAFPGNNPKDYYEEVLYINPTPLDSRPGPIIPDHRVSVGHFTAHTQDNTTIAPLGFIQVAKNTKLTEDKSTYMLLTVQSDLHQQARKQGYEDLTPGPELPMSEEDYQKAKGDLYFISIYMIDLFDKHMKDSGGNVYTQQDVQNGLKRILKNLSANYTPNDFKLELRRTFNYVSPLEWRNILKVLTRDAARSRRRGEFNYLNPLNIDERMSRVLTLAQTEDQVNEAIAFAKLRLPDAPYKGDHWWQLLVKRALQDAVLSGQEYFTWVSAREAAAIAGTSSNKLRLLYEQQIPKFLLQFTKPWGGKFEEVYLPDSKIPRPAIRLTEEIKKGIKAGIPYYGFMRPMLGGPAAQGKDIQNSRAQAEAMEAQGKSRDEIYRETWWYRDELDGEWRVEIDDSEAELIDGSQEAKTGLYTQKARFGDKPEYVFRGKLTELLSHPELFRRYPQLSEYTIVVGDLLGLNVGADVDIDNKKIRISATPSKTEVLDNLLHELQHAVQTIEKRQSGGNANTLLNRSEIARFELTQQINALPPQSNWRGELIRLRDQMDNQIERLGGSRDGWASTPAALDSYLRLIGEAEARNTVWRRTFDKISRQEFPPYTTEDVPREQRLTDEAQFFEFTHEELIDREVQAAFTPSVEQAFTTYWPGGRSEPYGISLTPAYGGDNNPKLATERGGFTVSMEFTPNSVAKAIKLYGLWALRRSLAEHIAYREEGAKYTEPDGTIKVHKDKQGAESLPRIKLMDSILADIEARHPELSEPSQYTITNIEPGVVEPYKGKVYTKEEVKELADKLIEAMYTLKGQTVRVSLYGEAGSINHDKVIGYEDVTIDERMIEGLIYDFDAQGLDGQWGVARLEIFSPLFKTHEELIATYRQAYASYLYGLRKGMSSSLNIVDKEAVDNQWRSEALNPDKIEKLENDLYVVRETADESGVYNYTFFGAPPAGELNTAMTYTDQLMALGPAKGYVLLSKNERGYEVDHVHVEPAFRGQRIADKVYNYIERDLDTRMKPSGILSADGYKNWLKRNPNAVRYHVFDPSSQHWYSPNKINAQLRYYTQRLASVGYKNAEVQRQVNRWKNLRSKVNPAAWGDPKLPEMFNLRTKEMIAGVGESMVSAERGQNTRDFERLSRGQSPSMAADPWAVDPNAVPETENLKNLSRVFRRGEKDPEIRQQLMNTIGEADTNIRYSKNFLGLHQIMWSNPHFTSGRNYISLVEQWSAQRMRWVSRADKTVRKWDRLPSEQKTKLADYLFWLTEMRYRNRSEVANKVLRMPTAGEISGYVVQNRISADTLALSQEIAQDFTDFLAEIERIAAANIRRAFRDPTAAQKALNELAAEMTALRSRPYFPMVRFGEWTITVRERTQPTKVIGFYTFVSQAERDAAVRDVVGAHPSGTIQIGRVAREVQEFMGLPASMIKLIKARLPGLTDVQRDWLDQMEHMVAPETSFRKRWLQRKNTAGYSLDAMRAYAHYFSSGSSYLARLEYKDQMQDVITDARNYAKTMLGTSDQRMQIIDYMQEHMNYIMQPGKEWAKLRSFIALWYLGFSPAAAVTNLTQIMVFTMPYLMARFGDGKALGALSETANALKGAVAGEQFKPKDPGYEKARQELISQGKIDAGQAPELAGYADGDNLTSSMAGTTGQKAYRQFSSLAMRMFAGVEKFNRELTFAMTYKLAMQNPNAQWLIDEIIVPYVVEISQLQARRGMSYTEAVATLAAREAIDRTQFIYAPWARPPAMRGGVGATVFVFMTYIQSALWAIRNNPGGKRTLLIMLALGGMMGLPGAEDLDALITALARRWFGADFSPKKEARKLIRDITKGTMFDETGPDLFLHGISRFGFGLGLLPDGVGAPRFDASANVGMGQVIPGFAEFFKGYGSYAKWNDYSTKVLQDASGAGFGAFYNLMQFLAADPWTSDYKKWEKVMPRTMKGVSRAARYAYTGKETFPSGATFETFDWKDPDDAATLIAQLLGFSPQKVTAKWEALLSMQETSKFYQGWRAKLYKDLDYAVERDDKEAIGKVIVSIGGFNREMERRGYPELGISASQALTSARQRERARARDEAGFPQWRSQIPSATRDRDLYPGVRFDVRVK